MERDAMKYGKWLKLVQAQMKLAHQITYLSTM